MANVDFHPEAQREYSNAVSWYQQRSLAAGRRFVGEVDRVVAVISAYPDRYPWFEEPFREAGLRRYPFSVIYRVEPSDDIFVFAVAHTSREPGYWHRRT